MGGKKATTTSSVSIPPEVLARYNAVNTRAETAATTPYEAFGKTASDYVAQLNARQNAGFNDINATAGSYQPYMTQATEATQAGLGPAYEGIDRYMSPYTKNVADTTGALMRQQQEQAQSGALGTAISSGAFGGDRAGIAAANLQQQNQMAYGKTMADIMNQGYTQALGASQADLARQLQGGSQLAGLGAQSQQLGLQGAQAKIAAGTMEQQTEQAGKDAMINQFMQEKGYPFQVAQFLANIATGTGAAAGSTTTTQTPRNWLGFASGGVVGPRTYTQSGIGGAGYVPAADLPVGQLMVAPPPEQQQGNGTEDIIKMIASTMGMASGGVAGGRHGYDLGGTPSKWEMMLNDRPGVDSEFKALGRRALTTALAATPFGPALGRMLPDLSTVSTFQPATTGVVPSNAVDKDYKNLWTAEDQAKRDAMIAAQRAAMRAEAPAGGVGAGATTPAVTPATGVAPTETAPTSSPRPMPRPAGLGAANVTPAVTAPAPTGVVTPAVTPAGGSDVAADAMKTINVGATPMDIPTDVKPIHLATEWDADRAKIIQRESGGDYDALFGFANRGDGPFADTKLTNMTVDQAINFSQPGGDYANYTKGKLGYVATPMGAFQIVGSTLNGAKAEMGLTGNEVMTPELQERIAKHLYDTYGMKPWAASAGAGDGLAGANMTRQRDGLFASDKPYEDRNAIGKFFYNPDGSTNQNALLSVLMGIGKGAEAQTISPLGGILSGIGSGAEAYKGLVKQAADVEATNLANVQNAMKNYSYAVYNGMTDMSWPEYAAQQGIDLTALRGVPTLMGQPPMDPITVADTRSVVTRNVKGVDYQIPFMQDLQSLNDLINKNVGAQSDPSNPMSQVVQQAIAARDQIMASGSTTDVNGNKVEVPAAIRAQNQSAYTVGMQQDREKFRDQGIDAAAQINTMSNTIGNMEKTLTDYRAGPLASSGSAIGALLQFTGANMDAMPDFLQNPEKYTVAAKDAALLQRAQLESIPGGAPAASIQFTNTFTPTPDMPPAAVRELLINMKAGNEYLRQYYEGFPEWAAKNPDRETDIQAYQEEFSRGRDQRYKDIVEGLAAKTPHFKGDVPPGVDATYFNGLSLRDQQDVWGMYDRGELTGRGN
jgi:hypothetical protein